MTDEELIANLKKGMVLKRTGIHSRWYGVIGSMRHSGDRAQIDRLVTEGRIVYVSRMRCEVRLPT